MDFIDCTAAEHLQCLRLNGLLKSSAQCQTLTNIIFRRNLHQTVRILDLSHSLEMTEGMSKLLNNTLSKLNTLNLSDCGLHSRDLSSLAKASVQNRLPQLKCLDISQNDSIADKLHYLFHDSSARNQLICLRADQKLLEDGTVFDDFVLFWSKARSGKPATVAGT